MAANGLSERVTIVEKRSMHVQLPERADVLVSEIIGNDPLEERILETTRDARQRLLKPGGRLIPSSLAIRGLPVDVPESFLAASTFIGRNTEDWRDWYGIDFPPQLIRRR